MRDIISNAMMELLKMYVTEQIPFAIVLDNHNNWDTVLPNRLAHEKAFRLDMNNTDLKDSYIDTNGNVIITAGIDDIVYTKVMEACDIKSIGLMGKEPLITKQFIDTPTTVTAPKAIPLDIEHSMSCMRKNNPKRFIKKVTDA